MKKKATPKQRKYIEFFNQAGQKCRTTGDIMYLVDQDGQVVEIMRVNFSVHISRPIGFSWRINRIMVQ